MAFVLFDDGKKLGEVSDWNLVHHVPVYKTFLGKTALSVAAKDECTFVSPKPVNRKSKLTVIEDKKMEYILEVRSVTGTSVAATVLSKNKV